MQESAAMLRTLPLVLAIGCASESLETTPCDEASDTLEQCTGQVPDGFREACAADPETVASTVLAEADAPSCVADGKADGLDKTVFVGGCSALVNAAFWVVWARSPAGEPLSPELKRQLRPWYGDLVDVVRVSWNSPFVTDWHVFGRDLSFDKHLAGQTFGDTNYVRDAASDDLATFLLMGHELRHVVQYRERGGIAGFARAYCTAFYDASYSYTNNQLEVEARAAALEIKTCLALGSGCP